MAAGRTETGAEARRLVIIAGPTASGKSSLALALAQRLNGAIINADAMQCYRELRILTARPSKADEAAAPHLLYGVREAANPANAAWWRQAALTELENVETPILCGGTGMYFSALLNGIAEIPPPSPQARATARALIKDIGAPALHAKLDMETGAKLHPTDSQRIARAYEVLLSTGHGLAYWQSQPTTPLTGWNTKMILLDPPRGQLREAVSTRFAAMLEEGALDELQAFLALNLDPALPLMRAHGVPELTPYLLGHATLAEATARAVLATHQYTKRQATWFRHQKLVENSAMQTIHARISSFKQFSESFISGLVNFINYNG